MMRSEEKNSLFLRGEQLIIPATHQELEEKKEFLLQQVQSRLLPVTEYPDDIEERDHSFDQKRTLGVLQKGAIIISSTKGKYRIAGTDSIATCIGISFYDPLTEKLAIVHTDGGSDVNQLQMILNEFDGTDIIQVRLFGGYVPEDLIEAKAHNHSKTMAKEILWFFYRANIQIDIRSADLLEALIPYRHDLIIQKNSTYIGFGMNCKNGKVLVFPYEFLNKEKKLLPYEINFKNTGVFNGIFKNDHVHVAFLQYLGHASSDFFLHYDAFDPVFNKKYLKLLNKKSREALTRCFIIKLQKEKIKCIDQQSMLVPGLASFIESNLDSWLDEFGQNKKPAYEILLHRAALDQASKEDYYLDLLTRNEITIDKDFFYYLINRGDLQKWCRSACRFYFVRLLNELRSGEDNNEFTLEVARCLKKINGSDKLLALFIRFEKMNIYSGYRPSNEDFYLIEKLRQCDIDEIEKIITEWQQEHISGHVQAIKKLIVSHLIHTCKKINYPIGDDEAISLKIEDILLKIIGKHNIEKINLDKLSTDNPEFLNFLEKLSFLLSRQFTTRSIWSSLFCYQPNMQPLEEIFLTVEVENRVINDINDWISESVLQPEDMFILNENDLPYDSTQYSLENICIAPREKEKRNDSENNSEHEDSEKRDRKFTPGS